eukprot:747249-Hanusia_phi.AAC.1
MRRGGRGRGWAERERRGGQGKKGGYSVEERSKYACAVCSCNVSVEVKMPFPRRRNDPLPAAM